MTKLVHTAIVVALGSEALYCAAVVLIVLRPEGWPPLPLGVAADDVPFEIVVERRLYAIEGWISFGMLVLYLAITELRPRLGETQARGS